MYPLQIGVVELIEVEGEGKVTDALVLYNYRIDECFDEQSNPACPGYVKPVPVIPVYDLYNALGDDAVTRRDRYEKTLNTTKMVI